MKTYVLTKDQLRLAILIGAKEQGIVPDEIYIQFMNSPSQIIFEKAENGASLSLDDTGNEFVHGLKGVVGQVVRDASGEGPATSIDGIFSEEYVKHKLSAKMERPPGLGTIRSWSSEQADQAVAWAENDRGHIPRPEFIKERAARGSKKNSAKVATKVEQPGQDAKTDELQDEFAEDVVPTPALSVEDAVASYFKQ